MTMSLKTVGHRLLIRMAKESQIKPPQKKAKKIN